MCPGHAGMRVSYIMCLGHASFAPLGTPFLVLSAVVEDVSRVKDSQRLASSMSTGTHAIPCIEPRSMAYAIAHSSMRAIVPASNSLRDLFTTWCRVSTTCKLSHMGSVNHQPLSGSHQVTMVAHVGVFVVSQTEVSDVCTHDGPDQREGHFGKWTVKLQCWKGLLKGLHPSRIHRIATDGCRPHAVNP